MYEAGSAICTGCGGSRFPPCKGGSPWLLQSLSRELLQLTLLLQQIYRRAMNKEEGKHLETHLHWTVSHSCPKWAASPVSRSAQCQCPARMASPAWLPVPGSVSLYMRLKLVWLCLKAVIATRSLPRASPASFFSLHLELQPHLSENTQAKPCAPTAAHLIVQSQLAAAAKIAELKWGMKSEMVIKTQFPAVAPQCSCRQWRHWQQWCEMSQPPALGWLSTHTALCCLLVSVLCRCWFG